MPISVLLPTHSSATPSATGAHAQAVFPGSLSIRVIFQAHLGASYPRLLLAGREINLNENLTYGPHAARSYRVKLQHQGYTEQHTTDNNIYIIYEKLQLNTLVWGLLTLAPITQCSRTFLLVQDAWSFYSFLDTHQFHRHLYHLHNDKHKNMQDHMNALPAYNACSSINFTSNCSPLL